ncbi:MAG: hypothetical protein AAF799_07465 [Myxococcota bacterium]
MAKNVKALNQGNTNGCGSTTLAMILNAFGKTTSSGAAFDRAAIDEHIRKADIFTSPRGMKALAEDFGLAARAVNGADFDLLHEVTSKSYVCQLLILSIKGTPTPADRTGKYVHFVVADWAWQGRRDALSGNQFPDEPHSTYAPSDVGRWVRIKDPDGGVAYVIRYEDLVERCWSNIGFQLLPTGIDNFAIIYADGGTDIELNSSYCTFDASATLVTIEASSDLVNALVLTAELDPTGVPKVITGALRTILGGAAYITKYPGMVLSDVTAEQVETGLRLLKDDPNILVKAGGGLLFVGSGVLWLAAQPFKVVGDAIGWFVGLFD